VLVSLLSLATVSGLIATGNLGIALVPLLLFLLLYAIWKVELRTTAVCLLFLCLAFEGPVGEPGKFMAMYVPGGLLMYNLNIITHIDALAFSGVDALVACMCAVILYRKVMGRPLSGRYTTQTARVLVTSATITLLGTLLMLGLGLVRGGDFKNSLWQCRVLMYLSGMVLLYHASLRGPQDHVLLGRVVVATACFRALLCLYIAQTFPPGSDYNYATSHGQSITFAMACTILIADVLERGHPGPMLRALLILPVLFAGMAANHRRLVWVELAATTVVMLVMSRSWLKQVIRRWLILMIPVFLLYVAVGMNSNSRIFAPVRTFTSVSSSTNASTEYRDTENANLLFTLSTNNLFGVGFGHEYLLLRPNYDISFFKLWRYLPHNMVLGLWAFNGLVGVSLIWFILPVGAFLSARAYRFASRPADRVAALCGVSSVVIYLIQCFGDIGTNAWTGVFIVGPAFACTGKLAVATGAWPSVTRRASRAEPEPRLGRPLLALPATADPRSDPQA
jgi:hypothetical protein